MLYFSKFKIISTTIISLILIIVCFSNFWENSSFLKKKINLGLDLQGGSYLLLEVDNIPVINKNLQNKLLEVKKFYKKEKITVTIRYK